MKKIKNISLIVLSIALLGLWSCNKAHSIDNPANESLSVTTKLDSMSAIDALDANDYDITNDGEYNEFFNAFRPWTSRTMAP